MLTHQQMDLCLSSAAYYGMKTYISIWLLAMHYSYMVGGLCSFIPLVWRVLGLKSVKDPRCIA